ncbi:MAG: hypothetical protein GY906_38585 [bacterium]|nr:hypothetical protein [bacterium]
MNLAEALGDNSVVLAASDMDGSGFDIFITWAEGQMLNAWSGEPGQYENRDVRTMGGSARRATFEEAKRTAREWLREIEVGELEVDDVTLVDDGTLDTVVEARGVEVRFSQEEADDYRDEDGDLDFERFVEDHLEQIQDGVVEQSA